MKQIILKSFLFTIVIEKLKIKRLTNIDLLAEFIIDFNIEKRKNAANNFEKYFF